MKIAVMFGPLCLSGRGGSLDLANPRQDPKGLTGSEIGFIRLAECMRDAGHTVELIVKSPQTEYGGMPVRPEPSGHYDAALAINEPDLLRGVDAPIRALACWLNDFSFARAGFDQHVDLYFSPSAEHMKQFSLHESWRRVEVTQQNPKGVELFTMRPEKWSAVHLGCDPERYVGHGDKVPGKCIYASSPDRGLHHVLEQWPRIKKAAPHATLHIFYRLAKWIQDLASVPYPFPPVEALRARALYINDALGRMRDPKWGITVHDSVSREELEREMASAECVTYPCDTVRWSEGFSCTLLEACAARACPVTLETDAFPDVYGGTVPMVARECITEWGDLVIRALKDDAWREIANERCGLFADGKTWEVTATKMLQAMKARMVLGAQAMEHVQV